MAVRDELDQKLPGPLADASPRLAAGRAAERCWEEIQAAMAALAAAEVTNSKSLYRTAAGVVAARADAFEQAMRGLVRVLEE